MPLQNVKPTELYETINLKYATSYSLNNLDKFNTSIIIEIAKNINKNINDISGFRTTKVFIKGANFVPPDPVYVPSKMSELIYEYNNSNDMDIIAKIAKFHIDFEHLHPFQDGNGRTGRVLINHLLLQNNEVPIVIPEERRTEYFNLLQNYDIDGFVKMIKELQKDEVEKMEEYGVDYKNIFKKID